MRCVLRKILVLICDWKKEPAGFGKDLCVERMLKSETHIQKLFMYSGGSDSQYILELFETQY